MKINRAELIRSLEIVRPDFVQYDPPDHGRIEVRKIWVTTELNDYLNFPHVGQAFMIQRETTDKKSDTNKTNRI